MNTTRTQISIDPKRNPISVLLHFSLDSNTNITRNSRLLFNCPYLSLQLHVEWYEKKSMKMIACVNTDVKQNKWGLVYTPMFPNSVKVFPIHSFTHLSLSFMEVINMCIFCCLDGDTPPHDNRRKHVQLSYNTCRLITYSWKVILIEENDIVVKKIRKWK